MSWKKNFCGRDRHTTDDNAAALPAPRPDALPSGSGRRRRIVVGLLAIAVISGCSSTDDFFKDQPPPPGGSQASFAERFRKLLGAEIAVGLGKLDLGDVNLEEGKRLARLGAELIEEGKVGYALIVARKAQVAKQG